MFSLACSLPIHYRVIDEALLTKTTRYGQCIFVKELMIYIHLV